MTCCFYGLWCQEGCSSVTMLYWFRFIWVVGYWQSFKKVNICLEKGFPIKWASLPSVKATACFYFEAEMNWYPVWFWLCVLVFTQLQCCKHPHVCPKCDKLMDWSVVSHPLLISPLIHLLSITPLVTVKPTSQINLFIHLFIWSIFNHLGCFSSSPV